MPSQMAEYWPYKVLINCWQILAHSPNTPNAAKVKKILILILYHEHDGMVKKPSHPTDPLNIVFV